MARQGPFIAETLHRKELARFAVWEAARDYLLREHGGEGAIVRRTPVWTGSRWRWTQVLMERLERSAVA